VTYHGAVAPNHNLRPAVIRQAAGPPYPFPQYRRRPQGERRHHEPTVQPERNRGAELLARVFLVNVLTRPRCQGRRPIISMITACAP